MNSFRFRSLLTVWCAAAFLTIACGQGTLNSPTGPSGTLGSPALTADDAADGAAAASTADLFEPLGRGNGKEGKGGGNEKDKGDTGRDGSDDDEDSDDGDSDDEDRRGPNRGPQNGRGMLSGFVTAVDADSLTLRGIDVLVTPNTRIRHGHRTLTLADISVGDHAQARGTMNAAGTIMTASEVKVEGAGDDDEDETDDDEAELRGAVSGLPGPTGCPALTFTVGTTIVKTTSATTFDDVACSALANGNLVEVEGQRLADGSIAATKVELQSGPNEVEGRISGLAGTTSCPILTFMIGTTTVTTSATTQFSGVMCSALANGARVEVEGTLTGTTLAAASLELH